MLTGSYYPHIQLGKPTQYTYDYARRVLHNLLDEAYGVLDPGKPGDELPSM